MSIKIWINFAIEQAVNFRCGYWGDLSKSIWINLISEGIRSSNVCGHKKYSLRQLRTQWNKRQPWVRLKRRQSEHYRAEIKNANYASWPSTITGATKRVNDDEILLKHIIATDKCHNDGQPQETGGKRSKELLKKNCWFDQN